MTERLAQLLHDEADRLDLPVPDAGTALSLGRGLRRRRRLLVGVATTAVLGVIGGAALGVNALGGDDDGSKVEPAGSFDSSAIFSIGNTVYLSDAEHQSVIDDKAIKSLYYTSVGVLVRHGDNNWSDGGGPQRFSLVRPDGSVERISVTTEETVHSTDATQPYLAYAEATDAGVDVVLRDLRDDSETARVSIPGPFDRDAWMPPPVSLDGDIVYVGTSPAAYAVDWRSGDVSQTNLVEPGRMPEVVAGRRTTYGDDEVSIIDVASGEALLTAPVDGYGYFDLSPDGRFAELSLESDEAPSSFEVYDVATGAHVTLEGSAYDYGWTPGGDLFKVSKDQVTTCSTSTGECTSIEHGIDMPPTTPTEDVCEKSPDGKFCYQTGGETWESTLRLGNRVFES